MSYTLEPACSHFSLPFIKLYRSTSSASYSMDSAPSMKNDVNPLNPPGYEGSYLSEEYEANFFTQRTIPVWVAYQHQADLQLQHLLDNVGLISPITLSAIYQDLKIATEELRKMRSRQEDYLNLPALIKRYDAEFLDLLKQASRSSNITSSDFNHFVNILISNKKEIQDLNPAYLRKQKRDANFIVKFLHSLPSSQANFLISGLLERKIIRPFRKGAGLEEEGIELKEFDQTVDSSGIESFSFSLIDLMNYESQLEELLIPFKNVPKIITFLQLWNTALLNHAKSLKEDIDSKQFQDIVFTGHSLGGACAQRGFIQFLIDKNRVPLPNHKVSLRLFDEPGIRFADNEAFKSFGNRHVHLMQRQQSKFSIIRRQEAGDFIVTGGEAHLGATFSIEEENEVSKWMQFDASVQSAVPKVMDFSIAYSTTAHATQFESGKRHSPWLAELAEKYLQTNQAHYSELQKIKTTRNFWGDYTRTWYSSRIQGMFNLGSKSQHWKFIKNLWNIPFVDSGSGEKIRLKAGLILRTESYFLELLKVICPLPEKDSDLHGEWWRYRDSNGVFVINEKGIITSPVL